MTTRAKTLLNIVADIGGTNTRVALARGAGVLKSSGVKYSNQGFANIETLLETYIRAQGSVSCVGACIAIAGPVKESVGRLTNFNWTISKDKLAKATGASNLAILNDMQAQGHALKHLPDTAFDNICHGRTPAAGAVKLVVGIATGYNSSVVHELNNNLLVPPSECGHADLSVQSSEDVALADHIRNKYGFCAIDDVLSGRGLERIYFWQGQTNNRPAERSAIEIIDSLRQRNDSVAVTTARQFTRLAAINIGNIALTHLPLGGIYLVGGVARAIAPYLLEFGFGDAFRNKGRFSEFMENFSVRVIDDDGAALIGCANYLEASQCNPMR